MAARVIAVSFLVACGAREGLLVDDRRHDAADADVDAPSQSAFALTPGWDFFPRLTRGTIGIEKLAGGRLTITCELVGAEPNQSYVLGLDVFDTPDPGVAFFGVPRYARGTFTREGVTATVDVFPVTPGFVRTDASGDGIASITFDVTNVPAGVYRIQLWLSRQPPYGTVYRTGSTYGAMFAVIEL